MMSYLVLNCITCYLLSDNFLIICIQLISTGVGNKRRRLMNFYCCYGFKQQIKNFVYTSCLLFIKLMHFKIIKQKFFHDNDHLGMKLVINTCCNFLRKFWGLIWTFWRDVYFAQQTIHIWQSLEHALTWLAERWAKTQYSDEWKTFKQYYKISNSKHSLVTVPS